MNMGSKSKRFLIYIADAFTNIALSGNPAAVCLIPSDITLTDDEMQKIAAEMHLSETAFIKVADENCDFTSSNKFAMRWFTPTTEVNLCGHATLASAGIIIYDIGNKNAVIDFDTKSGKLSVSHHPDKAGFLAMDFPKNEPVLQDQQKLEKLLLSCVGDLLWIKEVLYSEATKKLVIRLKDHLKRKDVESLKPNSSALMDADPSGWVRGIGVTLRGSRDNGCVDDKGDVYDFISRYFAPWNGIPEDPVTGSWHTVIGPYWAKELGKNHQLYARQCSPRGGDLYINVNDTRVTLMGQVVINLKGDFQL